MPLAVVAGTLVMSCAAPTSMPASQTTVHEVDFGRAISIQVGDTLKLDLMDRFFVPGSSIIWSADSSNADVLERTSVTRENPPAIMNAQAAHYIAVFKAIGKGEATIVATGATSCEAMNPAYCQQQAGTISVAVN